MVKQSYNTRKSLNSAFILFYFTVIRLPSFHGFLLFLSRQVHAMNFQPVETSRAERFPFGEDEERSGEVVAHVIEVRGQRVDATAEVDVVREEDDVLPEEIRDGETVQGVAPQRKTLLQVEVNNYLTTGCCIGQSLHNINLLVSN